AWQTLKARYPQDFSSLSAFTAEQTLAWHRREAEASEAAGDWFAVRFHFGRLLEAEPANEDLRLRRARAAIALADWQQASADYAKLPRLGSNLEPSCEYAGVLLLQGDEKGYRRLCRRLLDRFGGSLDPEELYMLGRVLALAPQEVTEPAQAVTLAEKAAA